MWANWADGSTYAQFHDNMVNFPFVDTIAEMRPWWIMRGLGGLVILFGNILFIINLFNTIVLKPIDEPKPLEEKAAI